MLCEAAETGDLGTIRQALANAQNDMGQFAEARRLYEAAVTGDTAELGRAGPHRHSGDQGQPGEPATEDWGMGGGAAAV